MPSVGIFWISYQVFGHVQLEVPHDPLRSLFHPVLYQLTEMPHNYQYVQPSLACCTGNKDTPNRVDYNSLVSLSSLLEHPITRPEHENVILWLPKTASFELQNARDIICCFRFARRNGYRIIIVDSLLSEMSIHLFNLTPIGLFLCRHLVSGRRRLLSVEMTRSRGI